MKNEKVEGTETEGKRERERDVYVWMELKVVNAGQVNRLESLM